MDFFSHALLPYLLGKSFKRNKEELTAFVLGGIAPDLDVLILWINFVYPTFFLISHRGITHSVFFGFITAIGLLYLASRSRIRSYIRRFIDFQPVITGRSAVFACAGATLHLFLDYLTTRGIPLLYPLSTTKYSAELFFYLDTFLMILSPLIIIYLYKKPQQKNTAVKILLIFLMIFASLGAVRTVEKNSASEFFQGAEMKAYPTFNPFDWYVFERTEGGITIHEYNGLEKRSTYNETVKLMNVLTPGDGIDRALMTAEELPQLKMFRWGAYVVAVNASFDGEAWSFEYYDPMQRVRAKDTPGIFKGMMRGFGSLNVTVNGNAAVAG
ncbi:MAG: metal-dependent hydrolase [Euryarchaeota archaeon]|nr:metal-dependent hydrolase [Euryarchaeota archaeon]MBU4221316.1 metal-dependent hydrolase [Euryarchaeota archaeon]